jgi:beta-1,4-N-acetylglucosaminyltransferase
MTMGGSTNYAALIPASRRDLFMLCLSLVVLVVAFLVIRLLVVFRNIQRNRRTQRLQQPPHQRRDRPITVLIVLGSGGHTTEMLYMTKHLNMSCYGPIHYCKASTDSTSPDRVRTMMKDKVANDKTQSTVGAASKRASDNTSSTTTTKDDTFIMHDIPRSREVGQSYLSSVFSTQNAFYFALGLVGRLQPQLILCNGPGTCLPICVAALLYRVLGVFRSTIVFCESYCRVQTLSLTGKLLYYVADLFIVHWKELRDKYPNTVLTTSFIQQD